MLKESRVKQLSTGLSTMICRVDQRKIVKETKVGRGKSSYFEVLSGRDMECYGRGVYVPERQEKSIM